MGKMNDVVEAQKLEHMQWASQCLALGEQMSRLDDVKRKLDEAYMHPDPALNRNSARGEQEFWADASQQRKCCAPRRVR